MDKKYKCKYCGRSFRSESAYTRHVKREHPLRFYSAHIIVGLVILGLLVGSGYYVVSRSLQPTVVSGIPCSTLEETGYHAHAILQIYVEGESVEVPGGIGFRSNCIFWLHTHTPDGVIHIEAPSAEAFTLGQFFDIWGEELSEDNILGYELGEGREARIIVNGEVYEGDPRDVPLVDRGVVIIDIGPPFTATGGEEG